METLQGQLRTVMDKFRRKRKLIKELQEDLQAMSNTLQSLNTDSSNNNSKLQDTKVGQGETQLWLLPFYCCSLKSHNGQKK